MPGEQYIVTTKVLKRLGRKKDSKVVSYIISNNMLIKDIIMQDNLLSDWDSPCFPGPHWCHCGAHTHGSKQGARHYQGD